MFKPSDLAQALVGQKNVPGKIFEVISYQRDAIKRLQTEKDQLTEEKAKLQLDHSDLQIKLKQNHFKCYQYLDMVRCGLIKDPPEKIIQNLIEHIVVNNGSIFDLLPK